MLVTVMSIALGVLIGTAVYRTSHAGVRALARRSPCQGDRTEHARRPYHPTRGGACSPAPFVPSEPRSADKRQASVTNAAEPTTGTTTKLNVRQAAFIGVGAMVGAGHLRAARRGRRGRRRGGLDLVPARRCRRRPAGLLVRQVRRPLPVGGRAARVRRPRLRRRPRHRRHRLADPRGQRHRHRHGRGVVRQLRELARSADGERGVDQGLRRRSWSSSMTLLNVLGSQAVARVQTVVVVVVIGILTVFAVSTLANIDLDLLAVLRLPRRRRHRVQRRPDVLRVPRLRRRHVHGQGPRQPVTRSCPGRSTSRSASPP